MKKFLRITAFVLALVVFCFSAYKLVEILLDRHKASQHYNSYDDFVIEQTQPCETETTTQQSTIKLTQPTEERPRVISPISIDFEALKAQYSDTVGFIHFGDDYISYPVVKGRDNYYYLDRLPSGEESASGSIFADNRVTQPGVCSNYIIYGHNMLNGSMFGSLNNYRSQSFYDEHPYYYYMTPQGDYRVDIVAGCNVSPEHGIYRISFTDDELSEMVCSLVNSSDFVSDTKYEYGDKIMTLSTCSNSYSNTRYILIGVVR